MPVEVEIIISTIIQPWSTSGTAIRATTYWLTREHFFRWRTKYQWTQEHNKIIKEWKGAWNRPSYDRNYQSRRRTLLQRLHSLLKLIWHTERIPSAWKKAIIVPILKKGDSQECKNYRGISLLSVVSKVFMKIIQSRLQEHREQTSREEQTGFRPHRAALIRCSPSAN